MKKLVFVAIAVVTLAGCSSRSNAPKVLAHRGFCTEGGVFVTDENTLDALVRAQKMNVDGVEFDVHMTADDSLVIRHDAYIAPGLDCQKSNFAEIRAYTLPFGNQIPTLQEWLDQAMKTPRITFAIEIKAHETAAREAQVISAVLDEVRKRHMEKQVLLLSFKPETCDEILRQAPDIRVLLNSKSLHHSMPPEEVARCGYSAISYSVEVTLNHPEWTKQFRDFGIETYLWMVECPYLKEIARDLGVDWVTTDFYDLVK